MTTKTVGAPRPGLTDEAKSQKNAKIVSTMAATRQRRKTQACRVFHLKIQDNKLNQRQKEALFMVFLEAKWLYNHCLASEDIWGYKPGVTVEVMRPNGLELQELKYLGSQIKQSIIAGIHRSIKSLSALKKRGHKVGRLRFKSDYHSLDLKQYGSTYRIKNGKIKVQNIPGHLQANGIEQLEGYELANAKLIKKPSGYHLHVTAFIDKNDPKAKENFTNGTAVGVDMGLSTHITLSNGQKFCATVKETERLKRLQRKLARQEKRSNGWFKTLTKIRREYEKIDNKKNDAANKLVHGLLKNELVVIQDENLASWKRKKGYVKGSKTVQHSILGRVKAKLSRHERVVVLDRFIPTTQTCKCGVRNKHTLDQRTYSCGSCGYSEDRDIHAAKNMLRFEKYLRDAGNLSQWRACQTQQGLPSSWQNFAEQGSVKLEAAQSLAAQ